MYRVKLENFEGPLDLLLFFIRRDELDVYDIPIAYITEQFLEYLHWMEELNLDVASEFIYMASTLMSIKAQMMVPREEEDQYDDAMDEDDPRYELVQRLLEYKQYKEMAEKMSVFERQSMRRFPRGSVEPDKVEPQTQGEALRDVTLFDLIAAYNNIIKQAKDEEQNVHKVERTAYTVDQQSEYIKDYLRTNGRTSFNTICRELKKPLAIVVSFLAILELVKEQMIELLIEDPNDITDFYLDLRSVENIY